jgi:hypothetical protein
MGKANWVEPNIVPATLPTMNMGLTELHNALSIDTKLSSKSKRFFICDISLAPEGAPDIAEAKYTANMLAKGELLLVSNTPFFCIIEVHTKKGNSAGITEVNQILKAIIAAFIAVLLYIINSAQTIMHAIFVISVFAWLELDMFFDAVSFIG